MVNEQVGEHAALVSGAGYATGGAIAKRFAREGMVACVTRRSTDKRLPLAQEIQVAGGQAFGFSSDACKAEEIVGLVKRIERNIVSVKEMVFNVDANVPCSLLEETPHKYFKIWEVACFSAFLVAKEVAKRMVVRSHGTLSFTGAATTRHGLAYFARCPCGAKVASRPLAQSMAREFGPENIHVA